MTTTRPQAFLHPATAAIPAALGTRARMEGVAVPTTAPNPRKRANPPHSSRSSGSGASRMAIAPGGAMTMDSARVNRLLSDGGSITQPVDPES
jgi:hypothetical protein